MANPIAHGIFALHRRRTAAQQLLLAKDTYRASLGNRWTNGDRHDHPEDRASGERQTIRHLVDLVE